MTEGVCIVSDQETRPGLRRRVVGATTVLAPPAVRDVTQVRRRRWQQLDGLHLRLLWESHRLCRLIHSPAGLGRGDALRRWHRVDRVIRRLRRRMGMDTGVTPLLRP